MYTFWNPKLPLSVVLQSCKLWIYNHVDGSRPPRVFCCLFVCLFYCEPQMSHRCVFLWVLFKSEVYFNAAPAWGRVINSEALQSLAE